MELIGIDVAKKTLVVARHQTQSNKHSYESISNTTDGIAAFLKGFAATSTRFVMEYTGNYELLFAHAAIEAGFKVSIIPGSVIRYFAKMKGFTAKTDRQDAKAIQLYATSESTSLTDFSIPSADISEQKQLRKALSDMQVQKQRAENRLQAHLLNPLASDFFTKLMEKEIAHVEELIASISDKLKALAAKSERAVNAKIPRSVPGVGVKIAAELILFKEFFSDFTIENIPKMIKLIGLSPSNYESGTSVRGPRSVGKGSYTRLKNALYMGAVSCVTKKKSNNLFKQTYEELLGKGKCFKVAIVAVMAKIARVALTLMIKQEMYDIKVHKKAIAK